MIISFINIPGYHFTERNRSTDIDGSIGLCSKNSIKFRSLHHLNNPNFEILWTWPRPPSLPRGILCLIPGTIYYPKQTVNDQAMLNHLASTLTTIEGEFIGCGLLLSGDSNRLSVKRITTQFRVKQPLNKPTRGERILDLVLTSLPHLYDKNSAQDSPITMLSSCALKPDLLEGPLEKTDIAP